MKKSTYKMITLLVTLCAMMPLWGSEKITFYHYDLLGSPVATTNELGEVLWREEYSPYGDKLLKQDVGKDNVRGYTGHVHDEETGLTYMQARYYDPQIGRFMGVDPVGFKSKNPVTFNRYAYAGDNPYKYTDPNGMCFWDGCTIEGLVLVEAATWTVATLGTIGIMAGLDELSKSILSGVMNSDSPGLPDSAKLPDMTGKSPEDVKDILSENGFTPGKRGSYGEWTGEDGSKVWINPEDGRISRGGPRIPIDETKPTSKKNGRHKRYDQNGNEIPDNVGARNGGSSSSHDTGENIDGTPDEISDSLVGD